MKNPRCLFATLVLVFSAAVAVAQSTPIETVKAFYRYDWSHSQIVNRRHLDARKKWLSPSLYRLFLSELEKERQYLKKYPTDKGYFGDGFPFSPFSEYFKANGKQCRFAYRIGKQIVRNNTASVGVDFFYLPSDCNSLTTYKVELLRTRRGWLINDLVYPGGSTLVVDMKKHRY